MSIFKDLFGSDAGRDSGNTRGQDFDRYRNAEQQYMTRAHDAGSQEFLKDALMKGQYDAYGKHGSELADIFSRTADKDKEMSSKPFGLQDQDNTAFTQMGGNLARMFGASDNQLSSNLYGRGLSNSGSANRSLMTSLGNKNEQVGSLMTNMANNSWDRQQKAMNANRDYLVSLSGQRSTNMGAQSNFMLGGTGQKNAQSLAQANLGSQGLDAINAQENEKFSQRMATANGGLKGAVRRGALSQAQGMSGGYAGDFVKSAGEGAGKGAGAV